MRNYVIFTDSACDIGKDVLSEWKVEYEELTYAFDGDERQYKNFDLNTKEFYDRMRQGGVAKTSAINVESFKDKFRAILCKGLDILYIAFSSGLSTTANSGRIAADELKAEFPNRKIIVVDGLCASAGQGLLVYLCVKLKEQGDTIESVAKFAEETKLKICHWFTVDDLVYLKRGGRISPTVAFVGGLLAVKPILHVDNEGKLVNVSKARGRMNSLNAIADKFGELCEDPKNATVFISHGDCIDDVYKMRDLLKKRFGAKLDIITDIGAVIGAHSGPGTLALFFVGRER